VDSLDAPEWFTAGRSDGQVDAHQSVFDQIGDHDDDAESMEDDDEAMMEDDDEAMTEEEA